MDSARLVVALAAGHCGSCVPMPDSASGRDLLRRILRYTASRLDRPGVRSMALRASSLWGCPFLTDS